MWKRKQRFCKLCAEEIICRNNLYCKKCNINRKKKPIRKNLCESCNKIFKTKYLSTKYCSDYCRKIVVNEKNKLRARKKGKGYRYGKIKSTCKFCEKEFSLNAPTHIFCSIECRKKYYENIQNFTTIRETKSTKWLRLRFEILKRDNFTCQYCGRNVREDNIKINIDHIIPRSKGGNNDIINLITSCKECNLGKSDFLLSDNRFKILKVEVQKNE